MERRLRFSIGMHAKICSRGYQKGSCNAAALRCGSTALPFGRLDHDVLDSSHFRKCWYSTLLRMFLEGGDHCLPVSDTGLAVVWCEFAPSGSICTHSP